MAHFVKSRMKRDNVSNLFQTPSLREHETTTASAFGSSKPLKGADKVDKKFFMHRDDFTDYVEDQIRYKHTMR